MAAVAAIYGISEERRLFGQGHHNT